MEIQNLRIYEILRKFQQRIVLVLLPTLLIVLLSSLGYVTLAFTARYFGILNLIDNTILFVYAPTIFSAFITYVWIKPLAELILPGKLILRVSYYWLVVSLVFMTTSLAFSFSVFRTMSGNKIKVSNPEFVEKNLDNDYFEIENFKANKELAKTYADRHVGGKRNQKLYLRVYFAIPMSETEGNPSRSVWLGIEYRETISNSLSEDEKQSRYEKFFDNSEADFNQTDFSKVIYFEKVSASEKLNSLRKTIEISDSMSVSNSVFLEPIFEPWESRLEESTYWLGITWILALVIFLMTLIFFDTAPAKKRTDH